MKVKKYNKLPYNNEYSQIDDIAHWLKLNNKKHKYKHVLKLVAKVGFWFFPYNIEDRRKVCKILKKL